MGPAQEAGPVDRVGLPAQDGLQEVGELPWVVLQVRVLDHHHVAGGLAEAGPERRPLPAVLRLEDETVDDPLLLEPAQDVPGPVGGAVVHHDDLELERDLAHPAEKRLHRGPLVVAGDHHGEDDPVPGHRDPLGSGVRGPGIGGEEIW